MPAYGQKWVFFGVAVLVIAAGVALRSVSLGRNMWVDEAESSINALTILRYGVPVDHYLGLPLFENTLTQPWDGHPEYEFRDSSYSSRGVTVYHGWLPLYAMAGAFWVAGIGPDEAVTPPRVQHTVEEMAWRSAVPRLPSVLFSVLTMALAFVAARDMAGREAAWAALVLSAFWHKLVWFGWQARYYSATLALSVAAGWLVWRTARSDRWRDHVLLGVVLAMLFHTHVLSCLVLGGLAAAVGVVTIVRRPSAAVRFVSAAAICAAGVLPWVVWSRFLESARGVVKARELLGVADVFEYPLSRLDVAVTLGVGVLLVALALLADRAGRASPRVKAFASVAPAVALLVAWAAAAMLAFTLLIPAASYFFARQTLILLAPGLLLLAVLLGSFGRALAPRHAGAVAVAGAMIFLLASGRVGDPRPPHGAGPLAQRAIETLSSAKLESDARFYATPNAHLILTYYTGLPVQSIAPVRRTFLDEHPGPIYLFEIFRAVPPPTVERVAELADDAGVRLTPDEAEEVARQVPLRLLEEELLPKPRRVRTPAASLPAYADPLLEEARSHRALRQEKFVARWGSWLIFRGYSVTGYRDWWQTFFYRFSDVWARRGEAANYVERMKRADVWLHPDAGFVLHRSPAQREDQALAGLAPEPIDGGSQRPRTVEE